jgi:hypothetical protein
MPNKYKLFFHPESDSYFIALENEVDYTQCDQIDLDQISHFPKEPDYKKMWERLVFVLKDESEDLRNSDLYRTSMAIVLSKMQSIQKEIEE